MTTPTVKAVGFACTSPEVIILFAQHKEHRLSIYPPKQGKQLTLSDDGRPNIVLLRSVDKLYQLTSWVSEIHRLIVFGNAKTLLDLGVPLLDTVVNPDGKTSPQRRQAAEDVLRRIEDEAVDLTLVSPAAPTNQPVQEKKKMPSGKTFVGLMRNLRDKVGKDNQNLSFVDDVGVPAVERLFGNIDQTAFRDVCKLLVTHGGLPDNAARYFYRWVEGRSGEGPQLSKAAEAYLYPPDGEDAPDLDDLAEEYAVDPGDIEFVCATFSRLHPSEVAEEESEDDDDWYSEESDGSEEDESEDDGSDDEPEGEFEDADSYEGSEDESEDGSDESSDFESDFGDGIFDGEESPEDDEEPESFDSDDSDSEEEKSEDLASGFSDAPDFGEFGDDYEEADAEDSGKSDSGFDGGFDDF